VKKLLGSPFVVDQALSSLITFVLVAALSRAGGASLVGAVAILQTIALVGLAGSRAIGIDVWAALGSPLEERSKALAPSFLVAIVVFVVNMVPWLILGGINSDLTLYWLASPGIVILDAARIILLHASRSWISIAVNSGILISLLFALFASLPAVVVLAIYLAGTFATVVITLARLRIKPPLPSLRYSLRNRSRSGPFLAEITLGSIMQQILFMLLAVLSSVEAAGQIRIAQTLLGPMSVIHAGLAPQLLRRLANVEGGGRRNGHTLLEILTGQNDVHIAQIITVCGATLSSGAIILGTGTAARILGLTALLNRWRLILVLPQVLTVALAASTGSALAAASGLALSAVATAIASIFIVSRNVGRGRRRA
jgi:hypothetical protein